MKTVAIAAVLTMVFASYEAQASGDAAAGERVFRKCQACHSDVGDEHKIGPSLVTVFGRQAGSAAGFSYSPAMKEAGASGLVWNEQTLDRYLESPRKFIDKNREMFPGLRDENERADVIAYLVELPKIAVAKKLEREIKEENDRETARLKAEEDSLKEHLRQLEMAKEALLMGAGPDAFDSTGFLRPQILEAVYSGTFDALNPDDYPIEYLYEFAAVVQEECPDSGAGSAQVQYGIDLFRRGLDPQSQSEILEEAIGVIKEIYQNPERTLERVAAKDAAAKAGVTDGNRFLDTYLCETNTGVSKRTLANLNAVLAGELPVYVNIATD
jgi:cytochrome c